VTCNISFSSGVVFMLRFWLLFLHRGLVFCVVVFSSCECV
jgi:hypothetical protein